MFDRGAQSEAEQPLPFPHPGFRGNAEPITHPGVLGQGLVCSESKPKPIFLPLSQKTEYFYVLPFRDTVVYGDRFMAPHDFQGAPKASVKGREQFKVSWQG